MIDHGSDSDFHRFDTSGTDPPSRINTPPFLAVPFFCLPRKSLGGVAVDLSCRVLDKQNQVIPGLYAVGELAGVGGINGRAALEGTMLGPSMLMGRVAAQDIVRKIRRPLKPAPREAEPEGLPLGRATEPDTLRAWRELVQQLIAQPRPGYWHFEKVHGVVLERSYDCARCHREPSP